LLWKDETLKQFSHVQEEFQKLLSSNLVISDIFVISSKIFEKTYNLSKKISLPPTLLYCLLSLIVSIHLINYATYTM